MIWPFKKKAPVKLWYPPCNSEYPFAWVDSDRPCPACLEKKVREDDALAARIRTHKTIHGDPDLVDAIVKGVVAGLLERDEIRSFTGPTTDAEERKFVKGDADLWTRASLDASVWEIKKTFGPGTKR